MSGPERDDELEAYLAQRSILPHRLASAERFEPPAELDRLVLARAKEAIRLSEPAPVYRPARWALPFGLAATLVLAFAVVLHMRTTTTPSIASAPDSAAVHAQDSAADAAGNSTVEESRVESARSSAQAEANSAQAYARRSLEAPALQSAPASAPSALAKAAPAPAPPPALDSESTARQVARELSVNQPPQAPAARLRESESAGQKAARELTAAAPAQTAAAQSNAIGEADAPAGADERKAPAAKLEPAEERTAVTDMTNRPVNSDAAGAARESVDVGAQAAYRLDPVRWLEQIDRLRRGGKIVEADQELTEFRKAHPGYPEKTPPAR